VLAEGRDPIPVGTDVALLEAWLRAAPGPLTPPPSDRITRLDLPAALHP